MPVLESAITRNREVFGHENPVAFVTGSLANRVGRVIATEFSNQGFRIVLHGRSTNGRAEPFDSPLEGPDSEPLVVSGLIQDEANIESWLSATLNRFHRIDVLVNSAAIWDPKPLEDTIAEDFERNFQINAMGSALSCKHFGLQMAKQDTGGAIVNIGDWAVQRPYRDFSAYFPSKAAVESITRSMAVELALRNPRIRVNAVLPGPVMLDSAVTEQHRQQLINECLLRREGTASDVAQAVLLLATNQFTTGACLPVDGGRSIYSGPTGDSIAHPKASQ